MSEFIKSILQVIYNYSIQIVIVLVALSSFALGRVSTQETREVVTITPMPVQAAASASGAVVKQQSGLLVASVNGSKYHFPWCSGAQQIKDSNKLWFNSSEEAKASGYTAAANCKGLE